jgi:hypothetical protein
MNDTSFTSRVRRFPSTAGHAAMLVLCVAAILMSRCASTYPDIALKPDRVSSVRSIGFAVLDTSVPVGVMMTDDAGFTKDMGFACCMGALSGAAGGYTPTPTSNFERAASEAKEQKIRAALYGAPICGESEALEDVANNFCTKYPSFKWVNLDSLMSYEVKLKLATTDWRSEPDASVGSFLKSNAGSSADALLILCLDNRSITRPNFGSITTSYRVRGRLLPATAYQGLAWQKTDAGETPLSVGFEGCTAKDGLPLRDALRKSLTSAVVKLSVDIHLPTPGP